jgi:hypothetical protein
MRLTPFLQPLQVRPPDAHARIADNTGRDAHKLLGCCAQPLAHHILMQGALGVGVCPVVAAGPGGLGADDTDARPIVLLYEKIAVPHRDGVVYLPAFRLLSPRQNR